jgi:hypothetical protein
MDWDTLVRGRFDIMMFIEFLLIYAGTAKILVGRIQLLRFTLLDSFIDALCAVFGVINIQEV